ncbi:MAG: iron-containing alcohol dehydrogenase family protein [Spirochaetota bacterium]
MEIRVPEIVRIKPNALYKIGKYLRTHNFKNIALYWGEGIKELFAETVMVSLDSSDVKILHEVTVTGSEISDIFADSLTLPTRVDAIVAVGGGKVIDYCKYLSFIKKLPMYSVPTVTSNDAFCSPTASLDVEGKKRSVSTKLPFGVIIDTQLLLAAPQSFLYSGMGDIFSKITSIFDWKLSYNHTGEYVNDFAAVITYNALDAFYYYASKDVCSLECIRIIAGSLMMCGVAMEIAGSSRPASGSEHLISHAYDRISRSPSLHGIQVGVASYVTSFLQGEEEHRKVRHVMDDSGFTAYVMENPLSRNDFIDAVKLAPNIKEDFFTVLSLKMSISRLLSFIDSDELINRLLV